MPARKKTAPAAPKSLEVQITFMRCHPKQLEVSSALLDDRGDLHVHICGNPFWAGEKYTILEQGWAGYLAEGEVTDDWLLEYGEARPADGGWNRLASSRDMLVTSHPVLVALALRAWWHRNGRAIPTRPHVDVPTFTEAVEEVRCREIHNDFNNSHAGSVPGLARWSGSHSTDGNT